MKAKPYKKIENGNLRPCEPAEATCVRLHMPGPISTMIIPVQIKGTREGTGNWTWNGNVDSPTLKPSILNDFRPHDSLVNHIFVNDGKVVFLNDCSHEFAGQTLDLLEVDAP